MIGVDFSSYFEVIYFHLEKIRLLEVMLAILELMDTKLILNAILRVWLRMVMVKEVFFRLKLEHELNFSFRN
jgi:hypothetical protein